MTFSWGQEGNIPVRAYKKNCFIRPRWGSLYRAMCSSIKCSASVVRYNRAQEIHPWKSARFDKFRPTSLTVETKLVSRMRIDHLTFFANSPGVQSDLGWWLKLQPARFMRDDKKNHYITQTISSYSVFLSPSNFSQHYWHSFGFLCFQAYASTSQNSPHPGRPRHFRQVPVGGQRGRVQAMRHWTIASSWHRYSYLGS